MPASTEPSIGELISQITQDARRFAQASLGLAKSELKANAARIQGFTLYGLICVLLLAQAGVFTLVVLAFVLFALGLPLWASFGIVTALLFIGSAVTGLMARGKLQELRRPSVTASELSTTAHEISEAAAASTPPAA